MPHWKFSVSGCRYIIYPGVSDQTMSKTHIKNTVVKDQIVDDVLAESHCRQDSIVSYSDMCFWFGCHMVYRVYVALQASLPSN